MYVRGFPSRSVSIVSFMETSQFSFFWERKYISISFAIHTMEKQGEVLLHLVFLFRINGVEQKNKEHCRKEECTAGNKQKSVAMRLSFFPSPFQIITIPLMLL